MALLAKPRAPWIFKSLRRVGARHVWKTPAAWVPIGKCYFDIVKCTSYSFPSEHDAQTLPCRPPFLFHPYYFKDPCARIRRVLLFVVAETSCQTLMSWCRCLHIAASGLLTPSNSMLLGTLHVYQNGSTNFKWLEDHSVLSLYVNIIFGFKLFDLMWP